MSALSKVSHKCFFSSTIPSSNFDLLKLAFCKLPTARRSVRYGCCLVDVAKSCFWRLLSPVSCWRISRVQTLVHVILTNAKESIGFLCFWISLQTSIVYATLPGVQTMRLVGWLGGLHANGELKKLWRSHQYLQRRATSFGVDEGWGTFLLSRTAWIVH